MFFGGGKRERELSPRAQTIVHTKMPTSDNVGSCVKLHKGATLKGTVAKLKSDIFLLFRHSQLFDQAVYSHECMFSSIYKSLFG